jgi:hypothetical protein
MLMNPLCYRLSLRQATRQVTQLCDQALAPLDLQAPQLSMLREIDRLGPIALNPPAEAMVMNRATPDHNVRSLERDRPEDRPGEQPDAWKPKTSGRFGAECTWRHTP